MRASDPSTQPLPQALTQSTPFVGRQRELAEIAALLGQPDCRLLSLTGPGGIGKTRLALEAARAQAAAFVDGVWVVPLQAATTVDHISPAIAAAIGLSLGPGNPDEQITHWLADKQALLVLDNLEQLADSETYLAALLLSTSALKLLVTSRTRLDLLQAWDYAVPGLDVHPPSGDTTLPDDSATSDAVTLFVQCARHSRRDFDLDSERARVVELCRMLEGMALAIELAASHVGVLSCADIVRALNSAADSTFEVLEATWRDLPPRHRSMRRVIDYSWAALTEAQQAALHALSVFRGGLTRDAAEQVAGASLALLASLVNHSWLRFDPRANRYDMHELLRQFCEASLRRSEPDWIASRARHARYYAGQMEQFGPLLYGARLGEALTFTQLELSNIRVAWEWAIDQRDYDCLDRLLHGVYLYSEIRFDVNAGSELLGAAVERLAPDPDEIPHRVWGRLLIRQLQIVNIQWDRPQIMARHQELRAATERALSIARHYGDVDEIIFSLWRLQGLDGFLAMDFTGARVAAQECLDYCRSVGNRLVAAVMLKDLAFYNVNEGRFSEALPQIDESIHLLEDIGDDRELGSALIRRASIHDYQGDYGRAEIDYRRAIDVMSRVSEVLHVTNAVLALGRLALRRGEFATARHYAEGLLVDGQRARAADNIGKGSGLLALLLAIEGDLEPARAYGLDCARLLVSAPPVRFVGDLGLAIAVYGLNENATAHSALQPVLTTTARVRSEMLALLCCPVVALYLAREGQIERAVSFLAAAYTHPRNLTGWMDHWPLLVERSEAWKQALGPDRYEQAWQRGTTLDVLAELQALATRISTSTRTADASTPPGADNGPDSLTAREREILSLIATGLSNRDIAEKLVLTPATVKWYNNQIFSKLGVSNRTEAAIRARDWAL